MQLLLPLFILPFPVHNAPLPRQAHQPAHPAPQSPDQHLQPQHDLLHNHPPLKLACLKRLNVKGPRKKLTKANNRGQHVLYYLLNHQSQTMTIT